MWKGGRISGGEFCVRARPWTIRISLARRQAPALHKAGGAQKQRRLLPQRTLEIRNLIRAPEHQHIVARENLLVAAGIEDAHAATVDSGDLQAVLLAQRHL